MRFNQKKGREIPRPFSRVFKNSLIYVLRDALRQAIFDLSGHVTLYITPMPLSTDSMMAAAITEPI